MSDLIRISDAFSLIDERGAKLGITSANRSNFKDILRFVKSVDAVEVVHGEWNEVYEEDEKPFFRKKYYCSNCGDWNTYGETNYCPNCGAKMDEVSE